MRKFLRLFVVAGMMSTSVGFVGCKGEDGDPGPAGQEGAKGDKGDKGDKGEQGEGVGATLQYGSIQVTLTGTRVDGVPFAETLNYRFAPVGADNIGSSSGVRFEGGNDKIFSVSRFLSTPDDVFQENALYAEFGVSTEGATPSFYVTDFGLHSAIVTDDFKYFVLHDNYSDYIASEDFSGFSYDPATAELKFKLNFVVPAAGNDTEHDLTVAATASVKVFEAIGDVTND